MTRRLFGLFAMTALLASCSHQSKKVDNRLSYRCDNGYTTYTLKIRHENNDSMTLYHPKDTFDLTKIRAASGEKYSDGDVTFWMKGNMAVLQMPKEPMMDQCEKL